jgi:mRNA interferase HigB
MRVIAKRTLKEFWLKHRDAEDALKEWHSTIFKAEWKNPNEIKKNFPSADHVGNNRIVFNICHNRYRLIVVFRYNIQVAFIRFIGTHKEYDGVSDIKNV